MRAISLIIGELQMDSGGHVPPSKVRKQGRRHPAAYDESVLAQKIYSKLFVNVMVILNTVMY